MSVNYEEIKKRLRPCMMSAEENRDLLATVPHERIKDMAMVFHLQGGKNMTALVTYEILKQLGVSEDQLRHDAVEQAQKEHPLNIQTINKVLGLPEDEPYAPKLYVATTNDAYLGSGVIGYDGFMEKGSEAVGGSFYLLPSSVHEVLLLRDDCGQNAAELLDMVKSINNSELLPDEKLIDNVYHYDSKEKIFETAEEFINRKVREAEGDRSVLKQLKEQKKESAKIPHREIKGKKEVIL